MIEAKGKQHSTWGPLDRRPKSCRPGNWSTSAAIAGLLGSTASIFRIFTQAPIRSLISLPTAQRLVQADASARWLRQLAPAHKIGPHLSNLPFHLFAKTDIGHGMGMPRQFLLFTILVPGRRDALSIPRHRVEKSDGVTEASGCRFEPSRVQALASRI
jgi:hypothetical protein